MEISELVAKQRDFFYTGKTKDVSYRLATLEKLKKGIHTMEDEIGDALKADLGKSHYEGYMCEISLVLTEINHMLKYGAKYAKPRKASAALGQMPSKVSVIPEPYGNVLIMSPWNYPFMLTMEPLVDAIMAGNTAIIKPSRYSPATSAVLKKLVEFCFEDGYVAVVEGGAQVNQELLDHKFDYIFFTGSKTVGKVVLEKAAAHLTPVTLELGGKSPCIVDETADLKTACNRIVFGKFINCGQTCVAPDYLLVHESIKDQFKKQLKKTMDHQLGKEPLKGEDYGKIINEKHYNRLMGLMEGQEIICGGNSEPENFRIEPTILDNVSLDSPIMQEEIFGPLFPIIYFKNLDEVIDIVRKGEKPLALYYFTTSQSRMDRIQEELSYGGGCFNDTIIHLASSAVPFGGVGESGMGNYHGKYGFETFSHLKTVVRKTSKLDVSIRFRPYSDSKERKMRKFLPEKK